LVVLIISCNKKEIGSPNSPNIVTSDDGFKASFKVHGEKPKIWTSASNNANQSKPTAGIDYFALRGGINPSELTLMSFGRFTDDTIDFIGRLTIFISSVKDTGTFFIGGTTINNANISIPTQNGIESFNSGEMTTGSLTITKYDTINNLIDGTFGFLLTNRLGTPLSISNGSFMDIPFKQ